MNTERISHGFGPFYAPDAQTLILGSFPSVKSREQNFYYGNPQNRFWKVLAALFDDAVPESLDEKRVFIMRHKLALYDVVESCLIDGSADATLRDPVPTHLPPVLSATEVGTRVFCNGKKAGELFTRLQAPLLGFDATTLPSTSSANAAYSVDKLVEAWRVILHL